jgi:diguanylate cyclase (GGDEF)-like protein
MVMASWPSAAGRGRRPLPAESVRRRVNEAMRRAIRTAIRVGVPMVVVGVGADVIHLYLRFGEPARASVGLGIIAILATLTLSRFGTRFDKRPEAVAFGILVVLYGVTLLNGLLLPEILPVTTGYLAAITVGSALFLSWSPRWHTSWLAVAVAMSVFQLLVSRPGTGGSAASVLMVTVLAALISAVGHPLVYRRMQRMLEQQFELRSLSRVAQRQERAVEGLNRELVRTARLDTVTGIGNRRALDEAMLALAGTRLAAVLLDLDHFKAFNDRNGHLAGDEALSRVGEILRSSVRRDDLVFRYGGEEFLILLPQSDRDDAARLAERVRVAVQDNPHVGPWGLTVSAGVAVADRFSATNPLGLLRRADTALYQAKRTGRNRVVIDDPTGSAVTLVSGGA